MQKNIPLGVLNIFAQMHEKWSEHPDNLPEKYSDINDGFRILYDIMSEQIAILERRKEYITSDGTYPTRYNDENSR